jgi:hypothetical protein
MTTTKATSLSKRAIDLLLRAMEARSMSLQTLALHQISRRATDALTAAAKLLVPKGHVPVVAGMDDYEDEPVEATWSAELKSYGYHDSTAAGSRSPIRILRRARSTTVWLLPRCWWRSSVPGLRARLP